MYVQLPEEQTRLDSYQQDLPNNAPIVQWFGQRLFKSKMRVQFSLGVPFMLYGIGTNDRTKPTKVGGVTVPQYRLWYNMLTRCCTKPEYEDCCISETFLKYSSFYDWCNKQIGFNELNFSLDKDLLVKGNKEYSENNCIFIPAVINTALTKSNSTRGSLPIGVHIKDGKYVSNVCIRGVQKYLGIFLTIEDAFLTYKHAKETYLISLAEEYKDKIDIRAYNALIQYTVEYND